MTSFETSVREISPTSTVTQPYVNLADQESRNIFKKTTANISADIPLLKEFSVAQEKKQEKYEPGREPRLAPKDEIAPLDKSRQAMAEYFQTGKLTPGIKKVFEDAIAESDKAPSPKLPALEARMTKLNADLEKVMPKDLQERVKQLVATADEKLQKASPFQKSELANAAIQAASDDPVEKAKGRLAMTRLLDTIAPEFKKATELCKPAQAVTQQINDTRGLIAEQKYHSLWTRFEYSQTLWDAGEKDAARQQFKNAVTKYPEVLDRPDVKDAIKVLGLDENELRAKKK